MAVLNVLVTLISLLVLFCLFPLRGYEWLMKAKLYSKSSNLQPLMKSSDLPPLYRLYMGTINLIQRKENSSNQQEKGGSKSAVREPRKQTPKKSTPFRFMFRMLYGCVSLVLCTQVCMQICADLAV